MDKLFFSICLWKIQLVALIGGFANKIPLARSKHLFNKKLRAILTRPIDKIDQLAIIQVRMIVEFLDERKSRCACNRLETPLLLSRDGSYNVN